MMTAIIERRLAPGLLSAALFGLLSAPVTADTRDSEAYQTGIDAYTYLYPLITMDVTRRQYVDRFAREKPFNHFTHRRNYPDAELKIVVRPNFDTLYSIAWLDLSQGPVIVSAPDTDGRYYILPMMDMWTNVFAAPGWRTTGTGARDFVVVARGWQGELPKDTMKIEAPTPYVWIIGRTQTNGAADFEAVNELQDGFRVRQLSKPDRPDHVDAGKAIPELDLSLSSSVLVNSMAPMDYFRYGFELVRLHPPQVFDQPIIARLQQLNIVAGESFVVEDLDETVRIALERGAGEGLKRMQSNARTTGRAVGGWYMNTSTMGVYGTHYLKRAIVAMVGLGALLPEDALYPRAVFDANGQPFDGSHRYQLHFEENELPPVEAFWSLTLYDTDGFQVANDINRFAIGDRDDLQYNADGSLDIYIQHADPGGKKTANWLPSPDTGRLGIMLRLYAPSRPAVDGRWSPPAIERID